MTRNPTQLGLNNDGNLPAYKIIKSWGRAGFSEVCSKVYSITRCCALSCPQQFSQLHCPVCWLFSWTGFSPLFWLPEGPASLHIAGGKKSLAGKFRVDHGRAEVTKQGLWVRLGQFLDFVNHVALEQSQTRAHAYCCGCLHGGRGEYNITTETLRHAKLNIFTLRPLTENVCWPRCRVIGNNSLR